MSLIRRFREPASDRKELRSQPPPSPTRLLCSGPNKVAAIQLTQRTISVPSPRCLVQPLHEIGFFVSSSLSSCHQASERQRHNCNFWSLFSIIMYWTSTLTLIILVNFFINSGFITGSHSLALKADNRFFFHVRITIRRPWFFLYLSEPLTCQMD